MYNVHTIKLALSRKSEWLFAIFTSEKNKLYISQGGAVTYFKYSGPIHNCAKNPFIFEKRKWDTFRENVYKLKMVQRIQKLKQKTCTADSSEH